MTDDETRDAKCPECQATQKRFEEISLKFAVAVADWEDDDTTIRWLKDSNVWIVSRLEARPIGPAMPSGVITRGTTRGSNDER